MPTGDDVICRPAYLERERGRAGCEVMLKQVSPCKECSSDGRAEFCLSRCGLHPEPLTTWNASKSIAILSENQTALFLYGHHDAQLPFIAHFVAFERFTVKQAPGALIDLLV